MKQISDRLFLELCAFFLAKDESEARYERICQELQKKLDKAVAREDYRLRLDKEKQPR